VRGESYSGRAVFFTIPLRVANRTVPTLGVLLEVDHRLHLLVAD
jgi:hypothetical protein